MLLVLLAGASLLPSGVARADAPSNDNFASATVIASAPFSEQVDVGEATREEAEPDTCGGYYDHTVWYSFTPGSDADTTVSWTTSTDTTVALGIYRGTSLADLQQDSCWSGTSASNPIAFAGGTTYYLRFAAYDAMTIGFGLGIGPPGGSQSADIAVTKMTVKKIPVRTRAGRLPSMQRRISVTVANLGPGSPNDIQVDAEVCGTLFCDFLGYEDTHLGNGESTTTTFTWRTSGYVGDFRVYASALPYDLSDPIEDNNTAEVDQQVVADPHGVGVSPPSCWVVCLP